MQSIALTHAYTPKNPLVAAARMIRLFTLRRQSRAALARLDATHLDDIGLSAKQAHHESRKPFFL